MSNETDDVSFHFGSNTITCGLSEALGELMYEQLYEEKLSEEQKAKAEKRE